MATYVIQANSTSQLSAALNSTKVKVATSVPVYVATGAYPTAGAGTGNILIPGNTVRDVNLLDLPSFAAVTSTGSTTGTGAKFDVSRATGTSWNVTINTPGSGYGAGNVLTIAGSAIGGDNTVNNISVTVTEIDSTGSITGSVGGVVGFYWNGVATQRKIAVLAANTSAALGTVTITEVGSVDFTKVTN
jgi:hypothetical protein